MSRIISEDYIIRIKSIIDHYDAKGDIDPAAQDTIELMARGELVRRGECFYISYNETETTGFEGCTVTLKVAADGSRAAILRYGRASAQLYIQRGVCNLCHYDTEVGPLTLGVTGDSMSCELTDEGGNAAFTYVLDNSDTGPISRNTFEISVMPARSKPLQ